MTDIQARSKTASADRPPASGRALTNLAYACMLIQGVNAGWLGPFLTEIGATMRVRIDQSGLIVSTVSSGYLIALLFGGEFSQRVSARQMLCGAMMLLGVGLFGMASAPHLGAMLAAGVGVGLGAGAIDIATNTIVAGLNRERLGAALNYLHLMFGVGALLGPLIVGFALGADVSYARVFAIGAAASVGIAILLWFAPPLDARTSVEKARGALAMLSHPMIWLIAAILFLYVGAETGIGAWMFSFLRDRTRASATIASWAVSLYWLGLVAGRFTGGALAHRYRPRAMAIVAALVSIAAIAVLIAAPHVSALAGGAIFLIGAGFGPVFPNMIAIGAAAFPAEVGRMTALVAAGGALGASAVPWAMGYGLAREGANAAMMIALGIIVLMIVCLAALRPRRLQQSVAATR